MGIREKKFAKCYAHMKKTGEVAYEKRSVASKHIKLPVRREQMTSLHITLNLGRTGIREKRSVKHYACMKKAVEVAYKRTFMKLQIMT